MGSGADYYDISVLVVEDDEVAADLLRNLLAFKYPGSRVRSANNGADGLKMFKLDRQDIVITDLSMPEMTGAELTAEVLKLVPGTPVITLTAHTSGKLLHEAREAGVTTYLKKPLIVHELIKALDSTIATLRVTRPPLTSNASPPG